jgi:phosphate acetyltransferase
MSFIESIFAKVKRHPKRVVFPEGEEDRMIKAAVDYHARGLGTVILLGSRKAIKSKARNLKLDLERVGIIDPEESDDLELFAHELVKLRGSKGLGKDEAVATLKNPTYFATMMLHLGSVDGLVGGATVSATGILRPLFQTLAKEPGVKAASSCSVLQLEDKRYGMGGVLYLADCSVIPEPNADQLADIALMAAKLARQLHGIKPRVAFLSYSTKGSANHKSIDKILAAAAIARQKASDRKIPAEFDGELQADAALIPEVAQLKAAHSQVAGTANVLIFPDLNSGNICSKLVQELARGTVYGPILNGLCKPASDLSRNCTVNEIVGSAAIVALQSVEYRKLYKAQDAGRKSVSKAAAKVAS